jgi:hypothetical protein
VVRGRSSSGIMWRVWNEGRALFVFFIVSNFVGRVECQADRRWRGVVVSKVHSCLAEVNFFILEIPRFKAEGASFSSTSSRPYINHHNLESYARFTKFFLLSSQSTMSAAKSARIGEE